LGVPYPLEKEIGVSLEKLWSNERAEFKKIE